MIGTVYIVHANFVGWLAGICIKGMMLMMWPYLYYLPVDCVRKNVLVLFSSFFIIFFVVVVDNFQVLIRSGSS